MKQFTRVQAYTIGIAFFCLVLIVSAVFFGDVKKLGGRSILITKTSLEAELLKVNKTEVSEIEAPEELFPKNNLTNISCENHNRRPIAVMIAGDTETRPLSGIGKADIVIEMPVSTGSITRMMGLFVCEDAEEIGSIRSSRHDFIYLAMGYDAVFAHWGGSHFAYDELNKRIVNNIDAMINPYQAFYRKSGISAPHNGFTSIERLENAAQKLGYRMESNFEGYKFQSSAKSEDSLAPERSLRIGYSYPYNTEYTYNFETDSYLRSRGGRKEIDVASGDQVEVKNVVVMRALSRQIGGGYNDVDIVGSGEAVVYKNGEEVKGTWKKSSNKDVLRFFDENGEEIKFETGKIWISIVEPYTAVAWDI